MAEDDLNISISFNKMLAVAAIIGGVAAGLYLTRSSLRAVLLAAFEWIDTLGPLAAVAFLAAYSVALLIFLPSTPFMLAAGALFGLWQGIALSMLANALGGSAAFLLARTRLRDRIRRRFGSSDALQAMEDAIVSDGLRTVMLIRGVPILPAPLVNYGLGLSPARFLHYLIGLAALMPVVSLYVYYGAVVGELLSLLSGRSLPKGAAYYGLLGAGLLALLALVLILGRRMRRSMNQRESGHAPA